MLQMFGNLVPYPWEVQEMLSFTIQVINIETSQGLHKELSHGNSVQNTNGMNFHSTFNSFTSVIGGVVVNITKFDVPKNTMKWQTTHLGFYNMLIK
jgi:hypothetical protein